MFSSIAVLGFAASILAQGVPQRIAPSVADPQGCSSSYSQSFSITTVNATTASHRVKRQNSGMGQLTIKLSNGVLTSNRGDTGYIAANSQFQFDNPPQTGAIYTAGFSVCANKTLAIDGTTIFYSCNSGNFNNLYSKSQGQQCSQVYIEALGAGSASGGSGSSSASSSAMTSSMSSSMSSATVAPASSASAPVTSIADSQPQAATSAASAGPSAVSQISDNQPQAATAATSPTPSPAYTGAAIANQANFGLAIGGLLAAAML